jgi:transcriptional regulator with XRE-family HTH domain
MKSRKKPIHPYLKEIGGQIKHLRHQKGLSLESLGASIGIDGPNMQKIENGANITLSSFLKIFIVLEVTPNQFFSALSWKLTEDDIDALTIPRTIKKKTRKK